jgi:hypothetical protein
MAIRKYANCACFSETFNYAGIAGDYLSNKTSNGLLALQDLQQYHQNGYYLTL